MNLEQQIALAIAASRSTGCDCRVRPGIGERAVSLYHEPGCGGGLLTELTDIEVPRPAPVDEARWFVINASDQLPHLEERVLDHAMYVGRRLDLAWRALEYRATLWIGDAFQEHRERAADDAAELIRLLDAAPSLRFDNPAGAAAAHLQFAISVIDDERFARSRVQSAILLFVARRSFSAYRVAKYAWAEGSGTAEIPLYQTLES